MNLTSAAIGCVGHPLVKTPHLNVLAGRGTIFQNAYTPSPMCVPTRASIACGDHVHKIGNWDSATPYCGERRSWMQHLRDQSFGKSQGMLKSGNERGNYIILKLGPKTQKTLTY